MKKILIYGANGYTAGLVVQKLVEKNLHPTLAGRSEEKVKEIADQYGLEYFSCDLSDSKNLVNHLKKFDLVFNGAGPYSQTAKLMIDACIQSQCHYLDVTGEIDVFELLAAKDRELKEAEIFALPGIGFDVVPTDCIAKTLAEKMPDAHSLQLAFRSRGQISRGTMKTMIEQMGGGGAERKDGKIVPLSTGAKSLEILLGGRQCSCVSIPWGDVSTAYYSTGIPNINVYLSMPKSQQRMNKMMSMFGPVLRRPRVIKFLQNQVEKKVTGPDDDARATGQCFLWGRVENKKGDFLEATVETLDGYELTALSSVLILERLFNDEVKIPPGFQTPSLAFGANYISEISGVGKIQALESGKSLLR